MIDVQVNLYFNFRHKTYVMIDVHVQVNLYFNFRHKTYVMIDVQVNLYFNFRHKTYVLFPKLKYKFTCTCIITHVLCLKV